MKVAELVRLRWLLGTLLIVVAALFAVGVAGEGDAHKLAVTTFESGEHNEATEQAEQTGHSEQTESSESEATTVAGINLESTPLVVLAVIVSLAFAAATWRTDHKLILLATALFAAAFAALDIVEFSHQVKESAAAIVSIAAIIAVLHAAAALLAEQRRSAVP